MTDQEIVIISFLLVGSIPFLIIIAANLRTTLFRRLLSKHIVDYDIENLPFLVRIHRFIVNSIRNAAVVYFTAAIFLFGTPLMGVAILYPEELLVLAAAFQGFILILTCVILLLIACNIPDKTGGLGSFGMKQMPNSE